MCVSKHLVNFWISKIVDYVRAIDGMQIDPLPEVKLIGQDEQENQSDDLLILTGGYVPALKMIVLYIDNRHLKDILRSYCHELVHHNQNLENSDYIRRIFSYSDSLVDSPEMEEVEADAFLRGNILFRKFTEWFKNQQKH